MNDGIIAGNGNSRYLKTVAAALSLYPTYQDFMAALIAGTFPIDLNGINEAGWSQLGTALNKANLLSDETASLLGLNIGSNPTVNDALLSSALAGKSACLVKLTVTLDGQPVIAGIPISGVKAVDGSTVVTDGKTTLFYCLTTTSSTTIGTPNYVDLPAKSITISTPILSIVSVSLTLAKDTSSKKTFISSQNVMFSPYVSTVDVCCIGGGGGGWGPLTQSPGGGGGYIVNGLGKSITPQQGYKITIGAGGQPNRNGGTTSFLGVAADGGKASTDSINGGVGNGNGGSPQSSPTGQPASGFLFNESGLGVPGGGGGGAGRNLESRTSGGSPNGGEGAYYTRSGNTITYQRGENGRIPGGGGGGGAYATNWADYITIQGDGIPGAGAHGAVIIRWR